MTKTPIRSWREIATLIGAKSMSIFSAVKRFQARGSFLDVRKLLNCREASAQSTSKLKVIDFLTTQNQTGGAWSEKSNDEQCALFKNFSKAFIVTPSLVQKVKDQIKQNIIRTNNKRDSEASQLTTVSLDQYQNQQLEQQPLKMIVPPSSFICFITGQIMTDPIFLTSGYSYEREAFVSFMKENGPVDPKTGQSVDPNIVVENINLKDSIVDYLASHPDLQKSIEQGKIVEK